MRETSHLAAYERWLEGDARARVRDLRRPLGVVGGGRRGVLGVDLAVLRRSVVGAVPTPLADALDAGRAVVPRRRAELRRAHLRAASDAGRDRARPRLGAARRSARRPGASCARRSRRVAGGPARARRRAAATAWPPTCRTSRRRWSRFLATASIGAIWSSCSPDFGARAVVDRFAQIEPKVLLAVDGYRYGGKDFDRRDAVARIRRRAAEPRAHGAPPLPRAAARPAARAAAATLPATRRRRRARVRAAAVRPPALGALLLRHDGPAEVDRPRAGRRSCSST